jgi:hypothetical protein
MRERASSDFSRAYALPLAVSVVLTGLMAIVLRLLGRVWWCKLGDYSLYVNEAWNSSHTSQHFLDPYAFTHILHGVLLFWLTGLLFSRMSIPWRSVIATVGETGWEVFENTNWIIEKYRENTASLDYFGDSVMNSVGDVLACAAGFWIAVKFGWWRSLAFFVVVEVVLILWIRDSLLLNILMLIYPLDGIKQWQVGI